MNKSQMTETNQTATTNQWAQMLASCRQWNRNRIARRAMAREVAGEAIKAKKERNKRGAARLHGLLLVVIGLLCIVFSLYGEEKNFFMPTLGTTLAKELTVIFKLLDELGIALISVGLVAVLVDLAHWQKYFQERIAETIVEKRYLDSLSQDELVTLQTNTFKAFFKDDDIARQDSFLDFFRDKIHVIIGRPYRQHAEFMMRISRTPDARKFMVEQTITFTCRKVRGVIQDKVEWRAWGYEAEEQVTEFEIELHLPHKIYQSPDFRNLYPSAKSIHRFNKNDPLVYNEADVSSPLKATGEGGRGFILSLNRCYTPSYRDMDGLQVKIRAVYEAPLQRLFDWKVLDATQDVSVVVIYPQDLEIYFTTFGFDQSEANIKDTPGLLLLKYGSWLLPQSGFAFHFGNKMNSYSPSRDALALPVSATGEESA